MRLRKSIPLLAALALTASALPAASAATSAYTQVLHAYEANGSVPVCEFTSAELNSALKGVDTYGAQYFQDFTSAIEAALGGQAAGNCQKGSAAVKATPIPGTPAAISTGSVRTTTSAGIPAPILLMAVIAALIALVVAFASLTRFSGLAPEWAQGWRHAWRETGERTAGTWAEFTDWLHSRR